MDKNPGFKDSWSGFIDYSACYHEVAPFWIAVGSLVFLGTGLSIVPQIYRLTRLRTSAGLSCLFVTITSIRQVLIVVNIFCLHNADFYGTFQISPRLTIPRFLSFATAFVLWFVYLPINFMTFVFFPAGATKREWRFNLGLSSILVFLSYVALVPYFSIGATYGFGSQTIAHLGKVCGIVSSVVTVCQYAPQFVTVFKLKDNGSFSLLTLGIQAPGGTVSTAFMAFGNGENWSTWLPLGMSALQQWFLLALCLFYKAKQRLQRQAGFDTSQLVSVGSDTYS
jgi:uncharacterized protein with PQ loop repeat